MLSAKDTRKFQEFPLKESPPYPLDINQKAVPAVLQQESLRKFRFQHSLDFAFSWAARVLACGLLVLAIVTVCTFFHNSLPSLQKFGWRFLISQEWNPVTEQFGALSAILGTLVTSAIAMLIAIPMSFGIALFITEVCPRFLQQSLRILIELLAGIPSIIYGMWGLFVLAPLFANYVQPWLISHLSPIAVIGPFFQGAPLGIGILTAGVVLSIMVIPFITSVLRDAFEIVPDLLKESGYALGATQWEVVRNIILPYCKSSIAGGIILGLGRAIGETMAVAFVIGNSHQLVKSILMPGASISSVLANEFSEATGKMYPASFSELGLILFMITLLIFTLSKFLMPKKH